MNRDRFGITNATSNRLFIRGDEGTAGVRSLSGAVPLSTIYTILLSLILIHLVSSAGWAATPSGTVIQNAASASFTPDFPAVPATRVSNTVSVTTTALHTTATIEYFQYAPASPGAQNLMVPAASFSSSGTASGPFTPLAAPTPAGSSTPINLTQPVPLIPAVQYHQGEPVFIRVADLDQNSDPFLAETIILTLSDDRTGDVEILRLTETGPNTGVFLGYIQSGGVAGSGSDGVMNVAENSSLSAGYTDSINLDTTAASVLVDPFGMLFSSATGLPVNGATVVLLNATTGAQAEVFGDDGISTFPASLTSGGTAQDSGGRVYTFSPGGYRFPFVRPGQYRLSVTPPTGFRAPSTVATPALQALPGGPFAIVDPGSRAEEFTVNPGPALHIDIPVDPVTARLYLIKTTEKQTVAVGDFIPYKLTVENTDAAASVSNVAISDRLPLGFRYRKGSATLNKAPLADPAVSGDGRSLTFSVGNLAAGARAEVVYVAEVGAGANQGKATNTATATGSDSATSNAASATVKVIEDLFMSKTTLVGRVFEGCADTGRGIAGVRIFLEDGTYVVTDKNGMYHFAALNPGSHVVQLDTITIPEGFEPVVCEEHSRFAGTPFSRFVELQGGSLWRADFHVSARAPREEKIGVVGLELRSAMAAAPSTMKPDAGSQYGITFVNSANGEANANNGYNVAYNVPLHVGAVPVRNLRLVVMMPEGARYRQGSAVLDGAPLADPGIVENALTFRLGGKPANWEGTLQFKASLPSAGDAGELVTKAFLIFDTARAKGERTPLVDTSFVRYETTEQRATPDVVLRPTFDTLKAHLSTNDRKVVEQAVQELKKVNVEHLTVIGHTDANLIRPGAGREFADNYALSRARAKTVADVLIAALKLRAEQVTILGKGPDEPVADNATPEGRAQNRRVELKVETSSTITSTAIKNGKTASGMKAVAVAWENGEEAVSDSGRKADAASDQAADGRIMPDFNVFWIETAKPGMEWLWPAEGHHPNIASTRIAIKHDPALKPKLLLNSEEVDPVFYEGRITKSDNTIAVSFWRGIHLAEASNRFELLLYDATGAQAGRMERTLHYSGLPVVIELVPGKSKLVADGKSPVVLAVRLLDKDGHPAREGMRGEYFLDPPYLAKKQADDLQKSPVVQSDVERQRYLIGENGIALIELAPTSQTGEAVLRFPTEAGTREVRAWLKPENRDWILVGLAEGTVGYDTVRGNMETYAGSGGDERFYEQDRLAFFAKGRIKGEWLLTLAYDSRKTAVDRESLYQTVDPNKYYTLYGDAAEQGYDAPSAKHIYVKLERDQFYALFGDYNTGLTVAELSKYTRNFTGLKSEWKTGAFEYNAFLADTNQAYVRDEIPGDGTSGLYRLSRRNIVLNSDTITIETRNRFRSEEILSTQKLTRHLDYTIDYEAGTLFFKSPVYSRDDNFNPRFIVVEYESFDASDKAYNYGGRAAVRGFGNTVELGASHIHEGRIGGEGNLEGADARIKLGGNNTLRAEIAESKTDEAGVVRKGSAYLAELQHRSEKLEGRAYVREQETGFGLGQQNGSETGTRKAGGDVLYRIGKTWTAGAEAYRQNNLATGAQRDVAELRGKYATGQFDILAGLRHAEDRFVNDDVFRSEQIFAGLRYQATEKMSVRLTHDQSVGSNENADFPTRTVLGTDYKLNEASTLYADQEWTNGGAIDTRTSRVGIKATPWTGGQLGSTVEQQATENGVRLFSTTGLRQTWQVSKAWSIDGGVDRSVTMRRTGAANSPQTYTFNANTPAASGASEDFTALSAGVGYRRESWSWTARAERRTSDSEDKYGWFTGANGEARKGLGLAGSMQGFRSVTSAGGETLNSDVRLGLAYRPVETRVIILDRMDYIESEQHGGSALPLENRRVVNNFVMNVRAGERTHVSFQYAAKYVWERIELNTYHGYTDLIGLEGRYDLTKTWDLGLRGYALHSWNIDQMKYGSAASVGYNAGRNIWVCVGYNFAGFRDKDFSQADFTSQGPFLKLSMKFDQVSVREAVKWFSGQ